MTFVPSDCEHPQPVPTPSEIAGCVDVIVRRCIVCGRELWWHVDRWRKL